MNEEEVRNNWKRYFSSLLNVMRNSNRVDEGSASDPFLIAKE